MHNRQNHITIFEHQILRQDQHFEHGIFDKSKLKALQTFYGEKGVPYYSLIHQGVKFCEYVGVIQVGNLTIEVLPKADKNEDESGWRSVLIGMLRAVGVFPVYATSQSDLRLKSNSILELYFELFIQEVTSLVHHGLIKKYRKTEGNCTALKGAIQFAKHLQRNVTHQERFYIRQTVFDTQNLLNQVLYKAVQLVQRINDNAVLHSRVGSLLLDFPEQLVISVTDALFERIQYDRKTERYRKAIDIARLLLLNYHPDLTTGKNHVLALMFDMNKLWEQFVYKSLFKHKQPGMTVEAQQSKCFWKPDSGSRVSIVPDIVLNKGKTDCVVLDTKWKNLGGYNPSVEDLRQMFVYHEYFGARKVALVYPGTFESTKGKYFDFTGNMGNKECAVLALPVLSMQKISDWQSAISDLCRRWLSA